MKKGRCVVLTYKRNKMNVIALILSHYKTNTTKYIPRNRKRGLTFINDWCEIESIKTAHIVYYYITECVTLHKLFWTWATNDICWASTAQERHQNSTKDWYYIYISVRKCKPLGDNQRILKGKKVTKKLLDSIYFIFPWSLLWYKIGNAYRCYNVFYYV